LTHSRHPARIPAKRRSRLLLEVLEERCVPTTYTVTTTADSGSNPLSLRQAIMDANGSSGNTIAFSIGSGGLATISPQSALPAITKANTKIDGLSQGGSGYTGPPLIELDGSSAGTSSNGLDISASGCTISGLVINNFGNNGITIDSGTAGNLVTGCYLGTDSSGSAAVGNSSFGIAIFGSGNTIGGTAAGQGNVASGNGLAGINIEGANNLVEGNICGLDVTGNNPLGNNHEGIALQGGATGNTVGTAGAGNVCSANGRDGVYIHGTTTSGNLVEGNVVGMNKAMTSIQNVGNGLDGILITKGAHDNTIGGTAKGDGDITGGNFDNGIHIEDAGSSGNLVEGCYIGTSPTNFTSSSPTDLGDRKRGIFIEGAPKNTIGGTVHSTIGGTVTEAGNVICANGLTAITHSGIIIADSDPKDNKFAYNAIDNLVEGNIIAANTAYGVHIGSGANDNTIGGTASGAGNIIGGTGGAGSSAVGPNGQDAVEVDNNTGHVDYGSAGVGNEILGNSITEISSGNNGINLASNSANTGNNNQASPVLISAVSSPGGSFVTGSLSSLPNVPFVLEFFASSMGSPPEGQIYLTPNPNKDTLKNGDVLVATSATGQATFTAYFTTSVPAGDVMTATATDSNTPSSGDSDAGDTSGFSAAIAVTQDTNAPVSSVNALPAYTNNPTFTVSYTASDPGSNPVGLAEVDIYARGPNDSKYTLVQSFTGPNLGSGSFTYTASEGEGTYSFYSIATDKAGNIQPVPGAPNTSILLDTTPPTSSVASPQYSNSTTFKVSFTANDSGKDPSGLASVVVYVKGPADSGYNPVQTFTGANLGSGSFSYTASKGEGSYSFYSIATDNANNVQPLPNPLAQATTLVDLTPPTSSVNALPTFTTVTTFTVSYTANDPGSDPSGLYEVDVYVKGPTDSRYNLAHAFTSGSLSSGSFTYNAGEGDGSYAFYSIATDVAGNMQAVPSGPNTTTLVDTAGPTSSASSPAYSDSTTFTVSYTASDPVGLAEVDVYGKGPTDSSYSLLQTFTGPSLNSGNFSFTAGEGEGAYSFYSIATDVADNVQKTPNPLAQANTIVDLTPPTSNMAALPAFTTSSTFTVSYTANDPGSDPSGLAKVVVYVEGPADSSYIVAHTFTGTGLSSGSFIYNADEGDGSYAFYSIAIDNAGNLQAVPGGPDTSTRLDTIKPTSRAGSPTYATSTTFTVSYTASDPDSHSGGVTEVDIYAKGPSDNTYSLADAFMGTALTSGSFSYSAGEGDGSYSFYSIATDDIGNVQVMPGSPDTTTFLDTLKPTSSVSSPTYATSTNFMVSYMASDPGSNPSGLARVDVYVEGPADSSYGLAHTFTGPGLGSGSFSFNPGEGEGSYSFYTIATDKAGNVQPNPSPLAETTTLVDLTPPTSSVAGLPAYTNATSFTVNCTANDPGSDPSGLALVDLYLKGPTDSDFRLVRVFTGSSLNSGSFSVYAGEGEGAYSFYSIAIDRAGNVQPNPTPLAQATTLVDLTPPTSRVTALMTYTLSSPFTVSYTASDPGNDPSGLAAVAVYVKGPTDSGYNLANTFTGPSLSSSSFSYTPGEGDGTYAFYSIAIDNARNSQTVPNVPDASTLVDTTTPTSSTSSPTYTNSTTFTVSYTASAPIGLAAVAVYAKGPADSSFSLAHFFTGSSLGSGSFSYTAREGEGNYAFYSIATDNAGKAESTSSAQTTTLLDMAAPMSSVASPITSTPTTFSVSYTASDPGSAASGVAKVDVYVMGPTDSGFSLAHTFTGTALSSGSFTYTAREGDGSYAFRSIATDNAGNTQPTLAAAQTSTLVGTATHLVVSVQPPSSVTAGSGFGLTIEAVDASGNVDTAFVGSVTLTISDNPGGGTLGGTITVGAVNGVANFSGLTLNKAGSDPLQATSSGLTSVITNAITVTPAAVSHLVVISQPPANVTVGAPIGFVVAAEDPFGNITPGFSGNVSVALANNPTGGRLGGKPFATASNGLAIFGNLTLNKLSSGFTLTATSPGLSAVTTNGINVVSLSEKGRILKGSGQSAVVGTTFSGALEVLVTGPKGKPAANVPVTFTILTGGAGGTFQAAGSPMAVTVNTSASGVAIAPALMANTVAGTYSVYVALQGVVIPAVFRETNKAGVPAAIAIRAGANQTATVGTRFAQAFQVVVTDAYGNVVSGAAVTFRAPATGACGTFAVARSPASVTVKTNARGVATAPAFKANKVAGSYSLSASIGMLTTFLSESNVD
jgi:hypothetical protein